MKKEEVIAEMERRILYHEAEIWLLKIEIKAIKKDGLQ